MENFNFHLYIYVNSLIPLITIYLSTEIHIPSFEYFCTVFMNLGVLKFFYYFITPADNRFIGYDTTS
jgi:hypothetical protein